MNTKKILSSVGTYAIVAVASIGGAALWTNVLADKYRETKERITYPTGKNVIDFNQAKRRMGR